MVKMEDVAKAAGVSVATVSRVLSGSRNVAPELSARVLQAQDQLGYRPNLVASSLRRQRTDTIGMVVPQVGNPYFATLMGAVSRRLQRVGKTVLLVDAEDDPVSEAEGLHRLLDRSVDGLLAVPVDEHASTSALADAARIVHLVQLDRAAEGVSADLVAVDQVAGMRAAVEHLVGLQRRDLAFISAEPRDSTARERAHAFQEAAAALGATTREPLFGAYTVDWGRSAARQLIDAQQSLPQAIVCGNDLIALGVLSALSEASVDVPGAVAVTGYDDIGFATLTRPALTTVRQPVGRLAAAAVDRLLSGDRPPRASVQRFAPKLVVRASTDPAAAGGSSIAGTEVPS
jgi:LacI family transcriptional regulator